MTVSHPITARTIKDRNGHGVVAMSFEDRRQDLQRAVVGRLRGRANGLKGERGVRLSQIRKKHDMGILRLAS
jgi:hypothetical protein